MLMNFYPRTSWLIESTDLSEFVENNTINLSEAGADPAVRVNNTSWPIPVAPRTDTPHALPLDTLDTENVLVRNVEEMEMSFGKMESVLMGMRETLRTAQGKRASFFWAPDQDGSFTPVIKSTGTTVSGRKLLKIKDIITLQGTYNDLDAPDEGRILKLSAQGMADLQAEDMDLFKSFIQQGQGFMLYGFKTYWSNQNPVYDSNEDKKAIGAAPDPGDLKCLAQSWVKTEVARCSGDTIMFATEKDPGQRGDIVGFQQRFLALPKRGKLMGAIIQGS